MTTDDVALYWDFENIHMSVAQYVAGPRKSRTRELVEVAAIVAYANSLGTININRAYADWSGFKNYRRALHSAAVDTVQRFGVGSQGSKNGADIRLALDVADDLRRFEHIDTVVVVSGDSDFIALAQRCRQRGRRFVGVGVRESCSEFFVKACNEFKYYRSLITEDGSNVDDAGNGDDPEEAWSLFEQAYLQLVDRSDTMEQNIGTVKALMVRNDPTFDEKRYGARGFTEFVKRFEKRGVVIKGAGKAGPTTVTMKKASGAAPVALDETAVLARRYRDALKSEGIELPLQDHQVFWAGVELLYRTLEGCVGGRTTAEFLTMLTDAANAAEVTLSNGMARRVIIGSLYRTGLALPAKANQIAQPSQPQRSQASSTRSWRCAGQRLPLTANRRMRRQPSSPCSAPISTKCRLSSWIGGTSSGSRPLTM